jgi:hypothetical protein
MERSLLAGFALLLGAGCGSGESTSGTLTLPPADAGPGAVPVYLDGGGAPAVPPDGAAACPAGACNYQTGVGCSGTTTACIPELAGGAVVPACSPPGSAAAGAACAQATDCIAGYVCSSDGTCHKLCCGGDWTGCESADEHCIVDLSYANGMGGTITTGAMLCYPVDTCDALAPTSCPQPGTTCQLADATGATACLANGTGQSGEPCPCEGGFACVHPPMSSGPICVRLCKAVPGGGVPYCQANEGICTHYTRDPAGVGECQPPGSP